LNFSTEHPRITTIKGIHSIAQIKDFPKMIQYYNKNECVALKKEKNSEFTIFGNMTTTKKDMTMTWPPAFILLKGNIFA